MRIIIFTQLLTVANKINVVFPGNLTTLITEFDDWQKRSIILK